MKIIPLKSLHLLCLCFLLSCTNNKSPFYEQLVKSEKGQLRGATGATRKAIQSLENNQFLTKNSNKALQYEHEMSKENSYTIRYHFSDHNELYAIELAVFLTHKGDVELLYQNFSTHFNRKYSRGKTIEEGYITWQTHSNISSNRVAIVMINDSELHGYMTLLI
jgi:hypothetical protein